MKAYFFVLLSLIWALSSGRMAFFAKAQPSQSLIPTLESAESVFSTALQAYEDQQYNVAERLFGVVANNYDLHRKTTAALLMQGKSLYLERRYQEAIDVLNALKNTYPTSRYIPEAERVIENANQGPDNPTLESQPFRLGIALPLNAEATSLSQQLFNGIHMAVEDHNQAIAYPSNPMQVLPKIQMIFRDTNNDAARAAQAVRDLIEIEEVDAIIGPLFSSEAIAAAQEAERGNIVMIAPLATAEEVSTNRSFVFQANPTPEIRGKLMARFTVRGLGIESVGLITDYTNSENLGMARGFEQELSNLGLELAYQHFIEDTRTWFRLSDRISRDSLLQAEAIYLPINGGNASTIIGGALGSLDRMGMGSRIRVIGNVEWHNIPNVLLASNYSTTYSNDFYVSENDSLALEFQNRYQISFGAAPTRLSYSGYDVTTFLARQIDRHAATQRYSLNTILREAAPFQGLGIRIDFSKGGVNEAMYYHRYRDGVGELLR